MVEIKSTYAREDVFRVTGLKKPIIIHGKIRGSIKPGGDFLQTILFNERRKKLRGYLSFIHLPASNKSLIRLVDFLDDSVLRHFFLLHIILYMLLCIWKFREIVFLLHHG